MPETRDYTTQLGTYFSIHCQLDKLRIVNHNTTTQPPTALTLAAPRHSSHDLRKIYASMLIENGESIVKVSRRLGHKKISTTFDHYAKLIESQK